ncbi:replication initiation and membrane attachment family protein [Mesomycoplasma bovoculi]|uniref:Chromosome replication initiation and membrane attachment protein n=1 Tax=Mesomycoplasma bovoculi M165/69 TaxID=743966 RepID=W5UT99_9BACT|nr:hypothetical protein [Mesomycoplasma bovoculi]AHH45372.1 chromosome replication initiation and membrane attachment protein [Mesomycoplasma bovoculi M165/69]
MDKYHVVNEQSISWSDLQTVLYFYFPIIKKDGFVLYHYLYTLGDMPMNFEILERVFQINFVVFESLKKIFEALGLISTFYNKKTKEFFIKLLKPIGVQALQENQYITQLLTKHISKPLVDELFDKFNQKTSILKGLEDVSHNYGKVFGYNLEKLDEKTSEIKNFNLVDMSVRDAKKMLDNVQFFQFLSRRDPMPSLKNHFRKYLKLGYTHVSINHFIEFCYKINGGEVNQRYFSKVVNDFYKNGVTSENDVKVELEEKYRYKKVTQPIFEPDFSFNSDAKLQKFNKAKPNNSDDYSKNDSETNFYDDLQNGKGWF